MLGHRRHVLGVGLGLENLARGCGQLLLPLLSSVDGFVACAGELDQFRVVMIS